MVDPFAARKKVSTEAGQLHNSINGPFSASGAGIICAASYGTCTGNSVDLSTTGTTAQTGILIQGSYLAVTGNEIYDDGGQAGSNGVGIQVTVDPANDSQTIVDVAISANNMSQMNVGIDVNSSIQNVSITNNNVSGVTNANQIQITGSETGCRVAGNLGWVPPAVSAPTLTLGTTGIQNPFPYDCTVSIAAFSGGSISMVYLNTQAIAWDGSTTTTGPVVVQVMVNGSIAVTGTATVKWTWTPQ